MVVLEEGDDGVNPFDPFFANEIDDDFDPLIPPEDDDDDGYWISREQEEERLRQPSSGKIPQATEWNDDRLEDLQDMTVTIDRARQQLFNQGKSEIGILEKGWGEKSPSFENLAIRTFGLTSRLFHAMVEALDVPYPIYCRWLATFYAACRRKMPVSQMLNDKDYNKSG